MLKKLTMLTAATAIVAGTAVAVDQNVDVLATFRQALTLTKNQDIDFTNGATPIEFAGTPAGTDTISMGSSGAIAYAGVAFSGPTTGTAGDVDIGGAATSAVNISCSTGATLANASAATVAVNEVKLDMNTGAAYGSAAYTCAGVGTTPHSHTLDGTDKILLGARIVGNATIASGDYSSALAGGTPVTVRAVYQ
ncbi:MAG: hypothetical protein WAZ18_02175 [Alphaproteobacteria bacterium]